MSVTDYADWTDALSFLTTLSVMAPTPDTRDWADTVAFVAAGGPANQDFPDWTKAVVGSTTTGGGSGSGPTFLTSSAINQWGSATSGTVNAPAAITAGNLLVMCVSQGHAGTTFTSSGFTQLGTANPLGGVMSLWVGGKIATGSEPTSYTVNFSQSGNGAGTVLQYSGATTNDGLPSSGFDNGTGTCTVPGLTPTGVGRIFLVVASTNNNPATITAPAGFGTRANTTGGPAPAFAVFDLSQVLPAATGAAAYTYTPFVGDQAFGMGLLLH